ncbi:hypothetical protein D3C72_1224300 [compost metagenome]
MQDRCIREVFDKFKFPFQNPINHFRQRIGVEDLKCGGNPNSKLRRTQFVDPLEVLDNGPKITGVTDVVIFGSNTFKTDSQGDFFKVPP